MQCCCTRTGGGCCRVVSKIMAALGVLRIPRPVEMMGLDFKTLAESQSARQELHEAEKALLKD